MLAKKLRGLKNCMEKNGLFMTLIICFQRLKYYLYNRLCIGRGTQIDPSARILGLKYIKFGKNFHAGRELWLHAVDEHHGQILHPQIIIGDDVSFSDWGHVGATHLVKIGNHVLFGSKCYVTDHNHGVYTGEEVSHPDTPPVERSLTTDSYVIIEDNVWVGDGVAILPGVTVGRGAIIATNAVVTKDIPPYTICAGIPARPIKKWNEEKKQWVKYREKQMKEKLDKKVTRSATMETNKQTNKQTNKCKICLLITILLAVLLLAGGFCGYKLIEHEHRQNQEISYMRSELSFLKAKVNASRVTWLDDGYNYLAIGNSITSHPLASYWWNENIGMAASSEDKDFVHLIASTLPSPSKFCAYQFSVWEIQSHDRAETLSLLDGYLSDKLNLVTIQLSENATEISTFEKDYVELIRYVKKGAPNAQIIVIDDFWDSGDKAKAKKAAAEKEHVDFISLEEIKGKKEYQAGLGTVVYDKEGNGHTIDHDGVAIHPGDKGMAYIADAVEKVIRK